MPSCPLSYHFEPLSSLTSSKLVVIVASAPIGQVVHKLPRQLVRVLSTNNFPPFGYPITPTYTNWLSCLACANNVRASRRVAEVPCTVKDL